MQDVAGMKVGLLSLLLLSLLKIFIEFKSFFNPCFVFDLEIDPPRNVRVSDVTHSSAVVMWTPPEAEISGYVLTYQEPDGTSRVSVCVCCVCDCM